MRKREEIGEDEPIGDTEGLRLSIGTHTKMSGALGTEEGEST